MVAGRVLKSLLLFLAVERIGAESVRGREEAQPAAAAIRGIDGGATLQDITEIWVRVVDGVSHVEDYIEHKLRRDDLPSGPQPAASISPPADITPAAQLPACLPTQLVIGKRQITEQAAIQQLQQLSQSASSAISSVSSSASRAISAFSQSAQQASQQMADSMRQVTQQASQSIQQAQQQASQSVQQAQQQAQQSIEQVQRSASQALASATDAASRQMSQMAASVNAAAQSSISAAALSASQSAKSVMASALSAVGVAQADASGVALNANQQVQQAQGTAVSVTQAAAAIVGAIVGSSLLSVLTFYLCLRYRRGKKARLGNSHRRNVSYPREDSSGGSGFPTDLKDPRAAAAATAATSEIIRPVPRYPSSLYSDTAKPQDVYVSEPKAFGANATAAPYVLQRPPVRKPTIKAVEAVKRASGVGVRTSAVAGPNFARFPTPKPGNGALDSLDPEEAGKVSGALNNWLGNGTTVSPFGTLKPAVGTAQ